MELEVRNGSYNLAPVDKCAGLVEMHQLVPSWRHHPHCYSDLRPQARPQSLRPKQIRTLIGL